MEELYWNDIECMWEWNAVIMVAWQQGVAANILDFQVQVRGYLELFAFVPSFISKHLPVFIIDVNWANDKGNVDCDSVWLAHAITTVTQ